MQFWVLSSKNRDLQLGGVQYVRKIYRAYSTFVDLFFSGIYNCQPFILLYSFFEQIFEQINCPLSGLIWITNKCRSKDQQGVLLVSAHFSLNNFECYKRRVFCLFTSTFSILLGGLCAPTPMPVNSGNVKSYMCHIWATEPLANVVQT